MPSRIKLNRVSPTCAAEASLGAFARQRRLADDVLGEAGGVGGVGATGAPPALYVAVLP